jgi:hypothetical protein
MNVYRAPLQVSSVPPPESKEEDIRPRTRCGYLIHEAFNTYQHLLTESGSVSSGKALHLAADLVCSGGLDIWIRAAYSFSMKHIGLANPRIFVYLRGKIEELDKRAASLPQEQFYNHPDVQASIGETVLVLQLCPKRASIQWPKVDANTKRQGWLRGVANATESFPEPEPLLKPERNFFVCLPRKLNTTRTNLRNSVTSFIKGRT